MDGILRPISKTSITTHVEIACIAIVLACTLMGTSLLYVPLEKSSPAFNGFSYGLVRPAILVLVKEEYLWYHPQL